MGNVEWKTIDKYEKSSCYSDFSQLPALYAQNYTRGTAISNPHLSLREKEPNTAPLMRFIDVSKCWASRASRSPGLQCAPAPPSEQATSQPAQWQCQSVVWV